MALRRKESKFSVSEDKAEIDNKCAICNKATGDNWLACEVCNKWFHAKCTNINEDDYKVLHDLRTCHWFCETCNSKVGKFISNLIKLHDRITLNEKAIAKI